MNMLNITSQLIEHEGLVNKVYICPAGKLTIGVGRNLEDRGLTDLESLFLLNNDIVSLNNELSIKLPFYKDLDDVRQGVLINMAFNMGIYGLLKFKNTLKLIEEQNYLFASDEMLDSKWARQVPNRAKELANLMKGGK